MADDFFADLVAAETAPWVPVAYSVVADSHEYRFGVRTTKEEYAHILRMQGQTEAAITAALEG